MHSLSKAIRLLVGFALLALPLAEAAAASYFVRANTSGGDLFVDSQTSIDIYRNNSVGLAFGSGDLSTGKLKVYADGIDPSNTNSMWIDFGDTVTVLGVTEPVEISLGMNVSGSISGVVPYVLARLQLGNGGFTCNTGVCSFIGPAVALDQKQWLPPASGEVSQGLSVSILLTPDDSTFSFIGLLNAAVNAGGVADFGHTATLTLDLPPGLTFESASGVFLAPIPEPPTIASLLLGVIVVLWIGSSGRRLRHRVD